MEKDYVVDRPVRRDQVTWWLLWKMSVLSNPWERERAHSSLEGGPDTPCSLQNKEKWTRMFQRKGAPLCKHMNPHLVVIIRHSHELRQTTSQTNMLQTGKSNRSWLKQKNGDDTQHSTISKYVIFLELMQEHIVSPCKFSPTLPLLFDCRVYTCGCWTMGWIFAFSTSPAPRFFF